MNIAPTRRWLGRAPLLTLMLGACGFPPAQYKLVTSSSAALASKPPNCEFRVVSMPPQGSYDEIGTLTPDETTGEAASDPEDFKRRVHADVCRAGGDVVVTEINGFGAYVRGIVLRKTASRP